MSRRQAAACASEARSKLRQAGTTAPSRLRRRARGRPAPAASAAGRPACSETRCGGGSDGRPWRAPAASARPSRRRSRAASRHHLDDGRHAAAFLADARRARAWNSTSEEALERLPSLSLRRWKRSALTLPSGQEARQQEAGEPALRLRQHQERIAHRRRHEPFVAGEGYSTRPAAAGWAAVVVLARTSVPPCFSVMPMPMVTPRLAPPGLKRLS